MKKLLLISFFIFNISLIGCSEKEQVLSRNNKSSLSLVYYDIAEKLEDDKVEAKNYIESLIESELYLYEDSEVVVDEHNKLENHSLKNNTETLTIATMKGSEEINENKAFEVYYSNESDEIEVSMGYSFENEKIQNISSVITKIGENVNDDFFDVLDNKEPSNILENFNKLRLDMKDNKKIYIDDIKELTNIEPIIEKSTSENEPYYYSFKEDDEILGVYCLEENEVVRLVYSDNEKKVMKNIIKEDESLVIENISVELDSIDEQKLLYK